MSESDSFNIPPRVRRFLVRVFYPLLKYSVFFGYLLYFVFKMLYFRFKLGILRFQNRYLCFKLRHLRFKSSCLEKQLFSQNSGKRNFFQYVRDYAHKVFFYIKKLEAAAGASCKGSFLSAAFRTQRGRRCSCRVSRPFLRFL